MSNHEQQTEGISYKNKFEVRICKIMENKFAMEERKIN